MKETDLIIIGAGPGGYRAAEYAAKQGLKVVIFEAGEVGGTCLNVGCIPTKTYVHSASFAEARSRMAQVVPQLRAGVEGILSHPNITLVRAHASLLPSSVGESHASSLPSSVGESHGSSLPSSVGESHASSLPSSGEESHASSLPSSGEEGLGVEANKTVYTAPHIIIATGSETKWLPIEGTKDNPHVVDSTGLLRMEQMPRRLVIIGAGVIGMEFASVFRRFGVEVTVIEYLKECLPVLDSDIAKRLRKLLEKKGVTFRMQCAVKSVDGGIVIYEDKRGQTATVEADVILMATGRKPRIDGLHLEALGVTLAPDGSIPVDDNFLVPLHPLAPATPNSLSSNIPLSSFLSPLSSLYAIGDCNGRQMLAHAAEMQAVRAVNHILGKTDGIRFDIMPAAIFTEPEAACVGPTEDQLRAAAIPYVCKKSFWRANGKALAMGETEGLLKLFVFADDGTILGCHAYGAHAADIVQEVSVLMCRHTTLSELADMVHIHPTLSEILKSAVK